METILALALVLAEGRVAPARELRFAPVLEQEGRAGCGPAAAASLLSLYCSIPADEAAVLDSLAAAGRPKAPGERCALADIVAAFDAFGLRSRPFRMDLAGLGSALASGFAPAIVHYARPRPHFALLLGRAGVGLVLADPAAGLEVLGLAEFSRRWSGAVVLAEPGSLSPEGRGRLFAALEGAVARRELLERGAAARAALRLAAGIGAADGGP